MMLLFKPEHVDMILAGQKTQTRRLGKKRWKVGGVHACYTRPPFAKGGAEPFCRVRIVKVQAELLWSITAEDAQREGYESAGQFTDAFWAINRRLWDEDPNPLVWVVTFEATP